MKVLYGTVASETWRQWIMSSIVVGNVWYMGRELRSMARIFEVISRQGLVDVDVC